MRTSDGKAIFTRAALLWKDGGYVLIEELPEGAPVERVPYPFVEHATALGPVAEDHKGPTPPVTYVRTEIWGSTLAWYKEAGWTAMMILERGGLCLFAAAVKDAAENHPGPIEVPK
jgi:hypothetical protein